VEQFRLKRLTKEILRLVNDFFLKESKNSLNKHISFSRVELSTDKSVAKIFWCSSTLKSSDAKNIQLYLNKEKKFFKFWLSKKLRHKRLPEIFFVYDDFFEKLAEIEKGAEILKNLSSKNQNLDDQ